MKASGIKHDGRAAKTAPVAAVALLGAARTRGVREIDPPIPNPDLRGDPLLDPGVAKVILSAKRS